MSSDSEDRRLDSKGRVTIPKSIRERLNIDSGEHVDIGIESGKIVIRPQISRAEFVTSMEGCVNEETRREAPDSLTPEELKADWTSDLPDSTP